MKKTQRVSIPFLHEIFSLGTNMISFIPTFENTADLFTKFLNCAQHAKFCADLGLGRLDSAMTSPMRGSIRVDSSASTNIELEPAAAGTRTDNSLLYAFLKDLLHDKIIQSTNESYSSPLTKELYSFLDKLFRT